MDVLLLFIIIAAVICVKAAKTSAENSNRTSGNGQSAGNSSMGRGMQNASQRPGSMSRQSGQLTADSIRQFAKQAESLAQRAMTQDVQQKPRQTQTVTPKQSVYHYETTSATTANMAKQANVEHMQRTYTSAKQEDVPMSTTRQVESKQKQDSASSILSRANDNIAKQEQKQEKRIRRENMEREQDHVDQSAQDQETLQGDMMNPKGDELIREVENLIVMGYEAKLPYERDFVGEGLEMINQIQ